MRGDDGRVSGEGGSAAVRPQLIRHGVSDEVRAFWDESQWRPVAMRPEERERLVRIGLEIVMGERAGAFFVRRAVNDLIEVGDEQHSFGYPPDVVLGDDPRVVLEHDVEWLVDELCETRVAWAKQLPLCPLHPGVHPLQIDVAPAKITASCPVSNQVVRSAAF